MTSEAVSRLGALTESLQAVVYLAPEPLRAYEGADLSALVDALTPLVTAVLAAQLLPFPNAMGLVRPSAAPSSPARPAPGTPSAGA